MTKVTFRQQVGFRLGLVGKLVILLMLASFLGCVAAVVPIIYYEKTHKGFVVTAQLAVEAVKYIRQPLRSLRIRQKKVCLVS